MGVPLNLPQVEETELGKSAVTGGMKVFGHQWWGFPVATALLVMISQWDHKHEQHRIRREFRDQVAARTGKKPEDVTVSDVKHAGKGNAVGEAMERSRKRRNVSVAMTLVGSAIALGFVVALAPVIAPLLAPVLGGFAATAAAGVVGFLSFMSVERPLEKWGEKRAGLAEPEMKEVERNPGRQSELSVSSQITYLQHRQSNGQQISREQVMRVFAKANPGLDAQIARRYGAPFAELNARSKAQVLQEVGTQIDIAKLTDDLNDRRVWAQELAFAAYGQASGVKRFDSPSVHDLKKKIDDLTAQLNTQQAVESGTKKNSVAFSSSRVSGVALGQGNPLGAGGPPSVQDSVWQQREASRRQAAQRVGQNALA